MFLLTACIYLLMVCTDVDADTKCIRFNVSMLNSLSVAENTTKNISFEVINECPSGFNLKFEVLRGQESTMSPACSSVGPDTLQHGLCSCVQDGQNLSCILNATFNRNETNWKFQSAELEDSDRQRVKSAESKVNVTYPPTITSFTLGNQRNIANAVENNSLQAVCYWNKGNPRRRMLLRNPENKTIHSKVTIRNDGDSIIADLFDKNATCSDTGLYVCEAEGVNVKESIFLQIQCPPQFLASDSERNTRFVSAQTEAQFDFKIFSYTNITKCTLAGPRNRTTRDCKKIPGEVNITGSPPKLKLTLVFRNVSEEDSGAWQLIVENEFKGKASIPKAATVNFTLDVIQLLKTKEDDMWWKPLMIISCVVAVAALGLCVIITVCYRSRKKSTGKEVSSPNGQTFGSREPLAAHDPTEDCAGMIVNELYSSSEPQGESIMITNDIYEGSGDTRTSTAPAPAPGYEEVKIDAGNGTVTMVSTKTTGNNAGVYANTAEADAQRKKEQEKEKNKKRPKERAPGPPASGMGEAKKNKKESNKKEKEASPSKSKAQTNTADAKTTNTAEKPEKGRNSGKKEAKPNSTEKTATSGNPTNDENKKANADASKTKPDAAKTKSDPAKTKTDASKSKPDQAKQDAPGAKADAPDTNANARTKTDANEGAASNDDQGSILVDARVPNAEGCLYGQLDFSRVKPRTTVIKDLPSTDYAEINFKAPPPPAPEN